MLSTIFDKVNLMSIKEETLYDILRISLNATLEEIKSAYRQRCMKYHPDVNPSTNNKSCDEMMCKINEVYITLKDIESKKILWWVFKNNYDFLIRLYYMFNSIINIEKTIKKEKNYCYKIIFSFFIYLIYNLGHI